MLNIHCDWTLHTIRRCMFSVRFRFFWREPSVCCRWKLPPKRKQKQQRTATCIVITSTKMTTTTCWLDWRSENTAQSKCRQSKNENRHFYFMYVIFSTLEKGKESLFRLLSKKSEHFQWNFRTGIQKCEHIEFTRFVDYVDNDDNGFFSSHFTYTLLRSRFRSICICESRLICADSEVLYVLKFCVTEKQQSKEVHVFTRCVYFFVCRSKTDEPISLFNRSAQCVVQLMAAAEHILIGLLYNDIKNLNYLIFFSK